MVHRAVSVATLVPVAPRAAPAAVRLLRPRHAHGQRWLSALAAGFARLGIPCRWVDGASPPLPEEWLVVWGHNDVAALEAQRAAGGDYLVAECGYLGDRLAQCSLGFNGLHGAAWVPPPGDTRRGQRWAHLLQPRHGGRYALIMGQVPGDAAIAGVDFPAWVEFKAHVARKRGLPVYYRPHPLGSHACALPVLGGSLAEDLAGAAVVYTYSSNSGVDAVLAGCAVQADSPRSMVYGGMIDRPRWLNSLAWRQWTEREVAGGAPLAHFLRHLSMREDVCAQAG